MKYILTIALALVASTSSAQNINGKINRVIDGDTFIFKNGTRIRLCGINAPERDEIGGDKATKFLKEMIEGKPMTCVIVGDGTPCDKRSKAKSFNRTVAQCYINGNDIAEIMVKSSHAIDAPRYSGGYYKQNNLSN